MKQQLNEVKRMQELAGLLNENINDGSSLNPRTKVIVDKLLAKTKEAIDAKDKDILQKIYNKALTVGGGSWDYFIDQLTDKGLASITPRGMLVWNFENPEELAGISEKTSLNPIKSIDEVEAILKEKIQELVQDYIDETIETAGEDLDFGNGVIGYDNKKQLIQDFFDYAKGYFDLKESNKK